ncbi:MAG: imidazoleglycerol-phosphate dehydratase HisB [Syntrophomonadaceae bacterium]|nr:imidazoleglycerol-phosphate dehydratase HisB [Syntrophomonadaceae bacterium]
MPNNLSRTAEIKRQTRETDIELRLEIDGTGNYDIDVPIPFLGHMLTLFTVHSLCNLQLTAKGDIEVDDHHTVEDIGICLGQALKEAVGDKKGINRYGEATVPMDEALVRVVLDFSGRAWLSYDVEVENATIGNLATENIPEFFQALASAAGMNLHVDMLRGTNTHHVIEATFKAFARALKMALTIDPRVEGVWSSKGKL